MNKFIAIIGFCVLHVVLSFVLPWWNILLCTVVIVFAFKLKGKMSWIIPLISLVLCWGVWFFIRDQQTGLYLSGKISALFGQGAIWSYLAPLILGGLLTGMTGYATYLFQSSFQHSDTDKDGFLKKKKA